MLSSRSVVWLLLWDNEKLVVAQTRIRYGCIHGNRTISGVTGVTKIGRTISDEELDKVALQAIAAVDAEPHGIFGVDMTFDKNRIPNLTEINIG